MDPQQNHIEPNQPMPSNSSAPVTPNPAPLGPSSSKPAINKTLLIIIAVGVFIFVSVAVLAYTLLTSKDKITSDVGKTTTSSSNTDSSEKLDTYIKFSDKLFDYHLAGNDDAIYDQLVEEAAKDDPRLSKSKLSEVFNAFPDKCYDAYKLGVPTTKDLPGNGLALSFVASVATTDGDTTNTDKCNLTLNIRKNTDGEYRLYIP